MMKGLQYCDNVQAGHSPPTLSVSRRVNAHSKRLWQGTKVNAFTSARPILAKNVEEEGYSLAELE